MQGDNLANYYRMNFQLMKHHGFILSDLEQMMPFERDAYIILLRMWLQEELERKKRDNNG